MLKRKLLLAGAVALLALPLGAQTTSPVAMPKAAVVQTSDVPEMLAETHERAKAGDLVAMVRLSRAYRLGENVEPDAAKAEHYDSRIVARWSNLSPKAAKARHVVDAMLRLADARPGLRQRLLTHASTYFGAPEAQFRLGTLLLTDAEGQTARERHAARWLLAAARKGHTGAQEALGDYLVRTGSEASRMKGRYWLEAAKQASVVTQPVSGRIAQAD